MMEFSDVKVELGNVNGKYYVKLLKYPFTRFDDVQFGFITTSIRIHEAFNRMLHNGGSLRVRCDMKIEKIEGVTYAFIDAYALC
jgi:hypothetical protein